MVKRAQTKHVLAFIVAGLLSFGTAQPIYAAAGTLGFSPNTGSFGKPFTVNLVVDGHGEQFNAAEATVTLPQSLVVQDLVLGDCNFSFLHTPTIENLSFGGVILSSSATKCTVYTLTFVPTAKGTAPVVLTKASVRRYGDAANILTATYGGNYVLTAALDPHQVLSAQTTGGPSNGSYTVNLKVLSGDTAVPNMAVSLLSVDHNTKQHAVTDSHGVVQFTNVHSGIYEATVAQNNRKVGDTILNVSGPNRVMTLSINIKTQGTNPLLKDTHSLLNALGSPVMLISGILLFGILLGVAISVTVRRMSPSKKPSV